MGKNMQKTAKKKHKFNAVDAAVIALILLVLGAVIYIVVSRQSLKQQNAANAASQTETFDFEYVVSIRTIRDEFADNFETGVPLIESTANCKIGDITKVEVTPATFTGTNLVTGELVYSDYPEHSDVRLTIKTKAKKNAQGHYILGNGFRITIGSAVYMRLPTYTGMGYCVELRETEGR